MNEFCWAELERLEQNLLALQAAAAKAVKLNDHAGLTRIRAEIDVLEEQRSDIVDMMTADKTEAVTL